jgi:hypothetical protein
MFDPSCGAENKGRLQGALPFSHSPASPNQPMAGLRPLPQAGRKQSEEGI